MREFILPFLVALLISLLVTPAVRLFAVRFGLVSRPNAERWHKKNTPVLGGTAMLISFIITYVFFGELNWTFWALMICSLGAYGVGLFDDLLHVPPNTKLVGQIIVASILIHFGFRLNLGAMFYLSIPLTILWIVGIMNAFNLLDNMDGLCAGIALIAAATMFVHSVLNLHSELALITAILAGATLGFLRFNFNPARIFMGDCGSLFLGFIFAALGLMGTRKEASGLFFTIFIPSLILAVPIFDTMFVALTRKMNSRPISKGGKDHTSHRLVALGLSEKRAVLLLYAIAVICSSAVLLYDVANRPLVLILSSMLIITFLLFGMFLGGVEMYSEHNFNMVSVKKKKTNGMPVILNGFIYNKRRIVEVIIDFAIICISYVSAFLLRFEGVISPENQQVLLTSLPIIISIKILMFFAFGVYRGIWKYIGVHDAVAIFKAVSSGSVLSILGLLFLFRFEGYSRALFVIDWLILLLLSSGVRIALRLFREYFALQSSKSKRVLILGAGDAGELLLREIRHNRHLDYIPIGFLDDDIKKAGKSIHGVPVLGATRHLAALCRRNKVEEVLVAIPSVKDIELAAVFEKCRKYKINFKHISSIMPLNEATTYGAKRT